MFGVVKNDHQLVLANANAIAGIAQKLPSYDPERVHGYELSAQAVRDQLGTLCAMTVADRRNLAGLPTQRADVIAAGDMVARKKPAPDVYELALERLDLPARHCLAIEDSAHGLHAAAGAGLAEGAPRFQDACVVAIPETALRRVVR